MQQSPSADDLRIYSEDNIDDFLTRFANKKHCIEAELLQTDVSNFVSNLNTKIISVAIGDELCSVSLNNTEYDNAVICSPYGTYLKYPLDLMKTFDKYWIKLVIALYSGLFNTFFKLTKLNRVAQVNSKLHSVMKHPNIIQQHLPQLTQGLIEEYPKHAILFFRVNENLDQPLISTLKKMGYLFFPDRVSHLYMPNTGYMKRSNTKRDIALLRNTPYRVVQHSELTDNDIERIHHLYELLFIDKYSHFNPKYTLEYFKKAIHYHWSEFIALRNPEGTIDAFTSWYFCDNTMICSQIGYDTAVRKNLGLYRMLVALMLKEANAKQIVFNMGAGSNTFKENRGSTPCTEYTAVYCNHLPRYRQWPWKLLNLACHTLLPKIFAASSM